MAVETIKVCDPYCVDCQGDGVVPARGGSFMCHCVTYVSPAQVDDLLYRAMNQDNMAFRAPKQSAG